MTPPDRVTVDGVDYVRAYPVTEGRCACCGRSDRPVTWTPPLIISAIQNWGAEHGHAPAPSTWATASPTHPHRAEVERMFGGFHAAVRAAGLEPYTPQRGSRKWDADSVAAALLDWTIQHGRPPKQIEWQSASDGHPASATARRYYGSWNNALIAAGITSIRAPKRGRKRLGLVSSSAVIETPVLVPAGRIEPLLRDWLEEGSGWDGGNPDCNHTIKSRTEGHKCTRCGARYQQGPNTMLNLASMAGLSPRRLWVILNRHARPATRPYGTRTDPVMLTRFGWVKPPQPNVELDTVDKLLLGMGVHPRNTELADLYDTEEAA